MKKFHSVILICTTLLALVFVGCSKIDTSISKDRKVDRISSIPTFFFHGYGSSINAERHIANAAVNMGD